MHAQIPLDPNVRTGTLPNGLKYYIQRNTTPEKRVEMRLAVKTGSIMEDPDQLGLAHFCEHMCFNGTANFKKAELVNYLEGIGVKFGPHLNAYTSFDETVYMIQVPTDDPKKVETGVQILEEWAHNVSFENEEIDKERGVVIEEWRLGLGAQERMQEKMWPFLMYKSRYADRIPIGKKEILETFSYDRVKQFYKDWYRPDLMSVVVVGDIDVDVIEAVVKSRFSGLSNPVGERERTMYTLPYEHEPLAVTITDKESPITNVTLFVKNAHQEIKTREDYRKQLITELIGEMMNTRLKELTFKPQNPYLFGGFFSGFEFAKGADMTAVIGVAKDNNAAGTLETLLTEMFRMQRHGFVTTELDRARNTILKKYESSWKEMNKTESADLVMAYVYNFLNNTPTPGPEYEYSVAKDFLPGITLEEINTVAKNIFHEQGLVITISGPEKEGVILPTDTDAKNILKKVAASTIDPYKDTSVDKPLVANQPNPGTVVSEKIYPKTGVTEWTLSNGAKVVLKPTTFKDNEISFDAFSEGGISKSGTDDRYSAAIAAELINNSGLGSFTLPDLEKKLAGKDAYVNAYISMYYDALGGRCGVDDAETMLQLVYLYFKQPRKDKDAFANVLNNYKLEIENSAGTPEGHFSDTLRWSRYNRHLYYKPWSEQDLNSVNIDKAFEFYLDRFADAGEFTFVFTGNIDPLTFKPLVEKWIGGLPTYSREEHFNKLTVAPPTGIVKKEVKKGSEPKSMVMLEMYRPIKPDMLSKMALTATMRVLAIQLRENMREEQGGVYGVGANFRMERFDNPLAIISIQWGCAPSNVDTLVKSVFLEMKRLREEGPSEQNYKKVMETFKQERVTDLQDNDWWHQKLISVYKENASPELLMTYDAVVKKITTGLIKKTAATYLKDNAYLQVILNPEK